jgi:alanyl-tRNA synthetase
LKAVQENERLLWKVSDLVNAPLEKLETTTKRLVREWKEVRREKEQLVQEIADLAAREYMATAEQVDGIKLVTRRVKEADVERLIETAVTLVESEPNMVVVLCGANKTARLVVMAGEQAVKLGVDSAEVAGEAASVLGGGGSGRPDFGQGGGNLIEKVPEALQKAEEMTRRQLERKKNTLK